MRFESPFENATLLVGVARKSLRVLAAALEPGGGVLISILVVLQSGTQLSHTMEGFKY